MQIGVISPSGGSKLYFFSFSSSCAGAILLILLLLSAAVSVFGSIGRAVYEVETQDRRQLPQDD